MRPVTDPADLAALTDDPLLHWAAQDLRPGVRVWADGGAVGVAARGLSGYDRLALCGPAPDAARIAGRLAGSGLRPIADAELTLAICDADPRFTPTRVFGWMDTSSAPDPDPRVRPEDDEAAVTALLRRAFPDSTTWPDSPGIERWWSVRRDGAVVAAAAECYSSRTVGYLSGVVSDPAVRGTGLGRAVVSTALHHLVRRCGRAALLANEDGPARPLYASLGLRWRPVRAAHPAGDTY